MLRTFAHLLPLLLIAAAPGAGGGATPVPVGRSLDHFGLLKPGVHRYVRYRVEGDKRTLIDLWQRVIRFDTADGRPVIRIMQRWDEASPKPGGFKILEQDSVFERRTFRPLTHIRREVRDGGTVVKAYLFQPDRAVGLRDFPNNAEADFEMPFAEPAFNFEYDMELLQVLPLAAGYAADIVFYDAGIDPKPDHYVFKVAGSEDVVGWDGRPVHCWVVTADYNTGIVKSTFWFDKNGQVLVREKQDLGGGKFLMKTLLPPEPGDG